MIVSSESEEKQAKQVAYIAYIHPNAHELRSNSHEQLLVGTTSCGHIADSIPVGFTNVTQIIQVYRVYADIEYKQQLTKSACRRPSVSYIHLMHECILNLRALTLFAQAS